jgi:hypothetical protein
MVFWRSSLALAIAVGFVAGPLPALRAQAAPGPSVAAPANAPLTEPLGVARAVAAGTDVVVDAATTTFTQFMGFGR